MAATMDRNERKTLDARMTAADKHLDIVETNLKQQEKIAAEIAAKEEEERKKVAEEAERAIKEAADLKKAKEESDNLNKVAEKEKNDAIQKIEESTGAATTPENP